jgi:hypothetical protein
MNENVSWSHIVLYVQMKAGIPRVVFKGDTINLNAMNSCFNPFVSSDLDVCQLCSLNVPETMYHFFFDCPAYFYIRSKLLKSLNLPSSQLDLFLTLNSNMGTSSGSCTVLQKGKHLIRQCMHKKIMVRDGFKKVSD